MSETVERVKVFVKKHWLPLTVGVVALYVVYRYAGNSSPAPTNNSAAMNQAYGQSAAAAAQAAQIGLATQTESDHANIAAATLAAQSQNAMEQNQVALTGAIGNSVLAIGSTIAGTIAAQSAIPIAAMNAATLSNQQALSGAAGVAATGVAAMPGLYDALAHLLGVQTGNFGTTLIGFGNNVANETGSALNAIATNSGSAVKAASASAQASADANQKGLSSLASMAGMMMMA